MIWNRLIRPILYTGHSGLVIALLVMCGTALSYGVTEVVEIIQPIADQPSYIDFLSRSVPGLVITFGVVYIMFEYLKLRDKRLSEKDTELEDLYNRTLDVVEKNSEAMGRMTERLRTGQWGT